MSPAVNEAATIARVAIVPKGQMANQMFQYMVARRLADELGGGPVLGCDLTEWGFTGSGAELPPDTPAIELRGHRLPFRQARTRMLKQPALCARITGWGLRLEYFETDRLKWQHLFVPAQPVPFRSFGPGQLVVHVRGGDILSGRHADYMPLPPEFIAAVAAQTGLQLVFVGQIGDDWYSRRLRERFPDAVFEADGSPVSDFQALRHATHLLLSTSTFSWLAAWLSESARSIHVPVLGIFNPRQRPNIDLLPTEDSRFRFYRFPVMRWSGESQQIEQLGFEPMSAAAVRRHKRLARFEAVVAQLRQTLSSAIRRPTQRRPAG